MKSEFEFINYHLNRITAIQASIKGKRLFVECYPTDTGALCFPNTNLAVKEIFPLPPNEPDVQECDATKLNQGTEAGNKK